jgi:hypothetical protein
MRKAFLLLAPLLLAFCTPAWADEYGPPEPYQPYQRQGYAPPEYGDGEGEGVPEGAYASGRPQGPRCVPAQGSVSMPKVIIVSEVVRRFIQPPSGPKQLSPQMARMIQPPPPPPPPRAQPQRPPYPPYVDPRRFQHGPSPHRRFGDRHMQRPHGDPPWAFRGHQTHRQPAMHRFGQPRGGRQGGRR